VAIAGPLGTPYEGGLFRLELFLPAEYPMAPPKVPYYRGQLMFVRNLWWLTLIYVGSVFNENIPP
jgi:hypothetical protein